MRYWFFTLIVPDKIIDLIEQDANALLWAANPELHSNEDDTAKRSNRYMTETASYLPQKEGAGSIMHLRTHIKAYQAQWVIKYLDPRRAPWKEVLDNWILHDNSTTTRPSAEASSSHNPATDTRAASTTSPTPAPSHAPASSPSTNS